MLELSTYKELLENKAIITQVLDPSHSSWVLGGVFSDLKKNSIFFGKREIYLPAPNSVKSFIVWFINCIKIRSKERLLFSSLTPLENYSKFAFHKKSQSIGLWFTHKQDEFTKQEVKALQLTSCIFTHSDWESKKLKKVTSTKQIVMLGALDPTRFPRASTKGNRIVWAGTSARRKRPTLFLDFVESQPDLRFLLIGNGWLEGTLASRVQGLKNLNYQEYQGPLESKDIDGCDIYLMTSETEGGPMPLLETLAAGIVPICTKTGFVQALFEFLELPKELIIEPNLYSINRSVTWVRQNQYSISIDIREQVLTLSFERLATLVNEHLN